MLSVLNVGMARWGVFAVRNFCKFGMCCAQCFECVGRALRVSVLFHGVHEVAESCGNVVRNFVD